MSRARRRLAAASLAVAGVVGLSVVPAQAAPPPTPTAKLTLKCSDPGSTREATMKVSFVGHEPGIWEISRTDYSTAPSPGWNADEVRLMQLAPGTSVWSTIHKWGTLAKANTVPTSGGSNTSTWPDYPDMAPLVAVGARLKLKLHDSGHYYTCPDRPVPAM